MLPCAAPASATVIASRAAKLADAVAVAITLCGLPALAATPPRPPPSPATPAASSAYTGHGAESLSPALLDKFRPRPIPSELSRRIQTMFDLRGPSAGCAAHPLLCAGDRASA